LKTRLKIVKGFTQFVYSLARYAKTMKRLYLLLVIVLSSLLTACSGVIGAIIGEREVENLFGLNDRVVELPLSGSLGLAPAQVGPAIPVTISVPFEEPFNDIGELNLPLGVAPRSASEEVGISPTIEFSSTSTEAAFPSSLGIANLSLILTFRDGSGSPIVQKRVEDTSGQTFTYNKVSPCEVTAERTVCQYRATVEEVYFFALEFEGEQFDTLFNDILQGGEATNYVAGNVRTTLSVGLPSTAAFPTDGIIKLVLKTRNGKVRFG
jgi:hypothetical protein